MQDKGARHNCRVKPMSAHGFLQHVENRHRAAKVCKLLMTAEISRVIYVGVRLNQSRVAGSRGRHQALNDRCLEAYGAVPGQTRTLTTLKWLPGSGR